MRTQISQLIAFSFLVTKAISAPTTYSGRHVVHECRDRLPSQWARTSPIRVDSVLPMRIALTQRNIHKGNEFLDDVSNPESSNYGKHWSAKQVAEMFAPSDETVSSILEWLSASGITGDRVKQSQSLSWIHANVPISEAESLLKTKYHQYTHLQNGQAHVACEEYSIPESLQKHIDFVTPTVHFDTKIEPRKKRRAMHASDIATAKLQTSKVGHRVQPGVGLSIGSPDDKSLPKDRGRLPFGTIIDELEHCDVSIVPDWLRALYLFPESFAANSENSYGIVEYTPQAYLPGDLDKFIKNFSEAMIGQRPILNSIDGGYLQTDRQSFVYNGESVKLPSSLANSNLTSIQNLDLEYAMSLVYLQEVTLYQVGDSVQGASFNNFLDAIDGSYCTYQGGNDPTQDGVYPNPSTEDGAYKGPENCGGFASTKVISTSYGYNEADLTPAYENRQCNEYMKLGLQGVTFLFSSGDYGVAGNSGQCIDRATGNYNNGKLSLMGCFEPSPRHFYVATAFLTPLSQESAHVTSVGATQVKPGASVTQPEEAAESVIYSGGGFSNVFDQPPYQADAVKTYFEEHKPPYGADRYNISQQSRGFPDVSADGVNYVIAIDGDFSYIYGTSASTPTFGSIMTLINGARLNVGKGPVGFINPVLYKYPGVLSDITSGGNQGCGTPGFTSVKGWTPVTGLGTPNFPKMLEKWLALR
ncbi:hypothetical protein BUE80_DR010064 [Diplocarpon rosae]|nr:hypothetical protein BUE80_DR010064 [Diplocarpon rosae]